MAVTPPTTPPTTAPAPPPVTAVPPTTAPGDPLGCAALVFDPGAELDAGAVSAAATSLAGALGGADVHVRAEGAVDGGLDARMAQLQAQCPTWVAGPDRAPNLVVVMYSSAEREASVFYGAGQADALELRWEHAVDTMGPRFAAGDFTGGVLTGLDALGADPPPAYTPTFSPTRYDDVSTDTSSAGVPPVIWVGLVVLVVVAAVRVAQFVSTGRWEDDGDDDDTGSSGWTSSTSRRSWSSSGRRRSSSSSRSSSSASRRRSAGRSGGGTKSW